MRLRLVFTLSILCAAVFYTFIAFTQLSFLSSTGRLGPGFFPRVIGIALIAICLYSMVVDRKEQLEDGSSSPYWKDTLIFTVLTTLFIALLNVLGGFWAMVVYMLATLSIFNRGRLLHNVLISVLLPIALFLLFDVWLNAAVPEGLIPFPG